MLFFDYTKPIRKRYLMQESLLYFFQLHASPTLDNLFKIITMLGEQYFIVFIITLIFWNKSKKTGVLLSFAFTISAVTNDLMKLTFHTKRPFQVLEGISGKRTHTATGYSFPSGHTQGSTAFFCTIAFITKRKIFLPVAILLSFLIGFSRLYLGVHWPVDIAGGLLFGIIVAIFVSTYLQHLYDDRKKFMKLTIIFMLFTISMTLILTLFNYFYLEQQLYLNNYYKISGAVTGILYGYHLEEKYYPFTTAHTLKIKTWRYLLGISSTLMLLVGLKKIFPDPIIFDLIRYLLVGFNITFMFPVVGLKLGLFKAEKN